MQEKPKSKTSFGTTTALVILVVAVTALFFMDFFRPTPIPITKVQLNVVNPPNQTPYVENLVQVIDQMKKINENQNYEKAIQLLESDRQYFLGLVTIVGILLSVSVIFVFINRLTEREDFDRLKDEMQNQFEGRISKIDAELEKLRKVELIRSMIRLKDRLENPFIPWLPPTATPEKHDDIPENIDQLFELIDSEYGNLFRHVNAYGAEHMVDFAEPIAFVCLAMATHYSSIGVTSKNGYAIEENIVVKFFEFMQRKFDGETYRKLLVILEANTALSQRWKLFGEQIRKEHTRIDRNRSSL